MSHILNRIMPGVCAIIFAMMVIAIHPAHAQDKQAEQSSKNPGYESLKVGDPDAPVKIEEYASLSCSHCAKFHNDVLPDLKDKYIDTGKVYLAIHDYPLNKQALDASMLVKCMPEDKRYSLMNLLFANQSKWARADDYQAALIQNAKLAGMSEDMAQKCLNRQTLKKNIVSNMRQASQLRDISSTPTFILNDGVERFTGAKSLSEFEDKIKQLN